MSVARRVNNEGKAHIGTMPIYAFDIMSPRKVCVDHRAGVRPPSRGYCGASGALKTTFPSNTVRRQRMSLSAAVSTA